MSLLLSSFSIVGLHGKYDVTIPIRNNRLILIGVNGLGKTTVVNLIYFLLTMQWRRLLEFEFTRIETTINDEPVILTRDDIERKLNVAIRYQKLYSKQMSRSPYPLRTVHRLVTHHLFPTLMELPDVSKDKLVRVISRDLDMPASYIGKVISDFPKWVNDDLFDQTKDTAAMSNYMAILKSAGNQQVIYLPTYRRIEQDLKSIFPNLEEDDLKKLTARTESLSSIKARGHIELVHFGMQDVEEKISDELISIRERTRSQLTNLTASYLRDIIRNRADIVRPDFFSNIDDETVAAVLDRVEENTLNNEDKAEVKRAISRIKQGESGYEARDKYLAYFFARLLDIYFNLYQSEENIRRLADTCNRYFERKQLFYDDANFAANLVDGDGSPLSWRMLSSGEKQVASLFTHLYLSQENSHSVIIDEPELSLSVPWQKKLLPDIVSSEKCDLLIAVTHSPFVYANELDSYVIDLARCITITDGAGEA